MEGRTKTYHRPFSRNSRSAELAAAVSAPRAPAGSASSAPARPIVSSIGRIPTSIPKGPVRPAVPKYTAAAAGSSSSTATDSAPTPPAAPVIAQEYSVRVPKASTKPISIMRFNGALGVEPTKWNSLKMVREDHAKHHHKPAPVVQEEDVMPKFGAGSEYGREAREEAKRKKYGGNKKKVNLEEQPWIMKTSENKSRKYRGVKEGGVSENASYYIFTQASDGAFEVFPINHWYNFTPIQRYKSLTAEEAEEQFGRRNKIYNYFSVMVRKRLKAEEDHDDDGEKVQGAKANKKKSSSGLQVSEMDEWAMDSDNDSDDSDKEDGEKKAKKKPGKPKKKKKDDSGDEAEEDSDDGDEEGREVDYISDSSESESEEEAAKKNAVIGVDQEDALKKLLDSDSEEEEKKPEEANDDEEDDESGAENDPNSKKSEDGKEGKKKSKKKAKTNKDQNPQENLSDDEDEDEKMVDELDNAIETAKLESGSSGNNSGNSRDGTPDVDGGSGTKRKATSDLISGITNASKKAKIELSPLLVQSAASEGITEEAVRRYLLRKPMTVTELLQKFKSKKTKIPSHDMVNVIAHILKKINPVKRTQNQKMYLYLTKT